MCFHKKGRQTTIMSDRQVKEAYARIQLMRQYRNKLQREIDRMQQTLNELIEDVELTERTYDILQEKLQRAYNDLERINRRRRNY